MLDAVRRFVEAGREALTPEKAEALARALVKEGRARGDQVARLTKDLATWSRRSSDSFVRTIRAEVKRQISKSGVATKDEVEALKRRIRKLESAGTRKTTRRTAATSSSSSKKRGSSRA
ncbi:MAG: hypothetical protein ACRDKA_05815 [Actinomycetota bacterium]